MSNPLSHLVDFLRLQMSGAPVPQIEAAVKGIEDHVAAEVEAGIAAAEKRIEARFEALAQDLAAKAATTLQRARAPLARAAAPAPKPQA